MIEVGPIRRAALCSAALALLIGGALLSSPLGRRAAMPGPLSSAHGPLVDDCGACHAESADALQGLFHGWRATEMDMDQTQRCLVCHDLGESPTRPHGWEESELAAAFERGGTPASPSAGVPIDAQGALPCAACHNEHQGSLKRLAELTDERCQTCHVRRIEGFARHPEFSAYPRKRATNLGFDHSTHILRHFPESEIAPPASCTTCHTLDEAGRGMPVRGYAEACASCHDGDILGAPTASGAGLAVLALPALDAMTLEERDVPIGRWPADAGITMAPLTPFVACLLSADPGLAHDLEALKDVDWLDLTAADDATLAAIARVAWGVKELFAELAAEGQAALLERLRRAHLVPSSERLSALVERLPEDLIARAVRDWFPDLAGELERHHAGETDATDSTPPAGSPGALRDREAWVTHGGWFLAEPDFVLRYRPGGHADPFLRAWLDLTAENASHPPARALFDALADPAAPGRCAKCHAAVEEGDSLALRWQDGSGDRGEPLVRFAHASHLASRAENACLECHALEREAEGFLSAFQDRDPSHFVPGFEPMSVATCASCHAAGRARSDCLTCHAYHRTKGLAPKASLSGLHGPMR